MSKYQKGNQICSMSEFEQSRNQMFIVEFGRGNYKVRHRSFLISWQYRVLQNFILRGWLYEAELKEAA